MFDTLMLPNYVMLTLIFGIGVIIGSFLNVVIYRLHTRRSLSGRSHCLSCGTSLYWFDLLPVVSYLALRGKCRFCHSHITVRYFLVELATGLLFVSIFLTTSLLLPTVLMLLVVSVLVVVVVYDYYHLIIPDVLVLWLLVLAAVWLGYEWWRTDDLLLVWWHIAAATAGAGFFALLWLLSRGRWLGLGDAKLAFPLGIILGPASVFTFVVFSFWIGAIMSLLIISIQWYRRRGKPHLRFLQQPLTIKSEVPFAPFLVLSFLLLYFWSVDALQLVSYLF